MNAQVCLTLCNPMTCSLPGFSVHGIFQARIPQWVAISFSRGHSWPRYQTPVSSVSCISGRFFTHWAIREALYSREFPQSGTEPISSAHWANSLLLSHWGSHIYISVYLIIYLSINTHTIQRIYSTIKTNSAICTIMDASRGYYAKWNTSKTNTISSHLCADPKNKWTNIKRQKQRTKGGKRLQRGKDQRG